MPRIEEYQPERLADELAGPRLLYRRYRTRLPPRLTIQSDGTRMSSAYGHTGKGRYLDEYLGPRLAPIVMPVYHECVRRGLPVYTIANIDDIYGRIVAYERLLLPFSEGSNVTHVIASLKTISEDGGFEIRNLMRGNDALPTREASRGYRSRSFPPRARPYSGRRRDRIQLVSNGIRARQSLGGQIRETARSAQRVAARARQVSSAARPPATIQPDRIADELADMMGFDVDGERRHRAVSDHPGRLETDRDLRQRAHRSRQADQPLSRRRDRARAICARGSLLPRLPGAKAADLFDFDGAGSRRQGRFL